MYGQLSPAPFMNISFELLLFFCLGHYGSFIKIAEPVITQI